MWEEDDMVTLWCLVECPAGAWAGEGRWPIPTNSQEDSELALRIQCALMGALLKLVKGDERFSMSLIATKLSARPIDWAFQRDVDLQQNILDNQEQLSWTEVPTQLLKED